MSDIAEGIGAAVEGTLAGHAVEPNRGEARYDPELATSGDNACLNCGHAAPDNFCANCGQKTKIHRTLSAILHDLIHGVLHLDGKLWRTLPLLAFKPGQITRRYIEGERAKFVSPMAMFLFSIFTMFAVFQMVGLTTPTSLDLGETVRAQASARADELRAQIATLPEDDPERQRAEEGLEEVERFLETGEVGTITTENANGGETELPFDLSDLEFNLTGNKAFDQGILKKWSENPGLMLYKLQANGYKFSWLLIPLSIPFVWLMFLWKRRFRAYDHAIFVTYSLSFMSLLFIAISLVGVSPLGPGWAFAIFALVAPLHIYKHLRHTYELGRFSTLWRFVFLLVFMTIVVVLFLQVLLLLGAF